MDDIRTSKLTNDPLAHLAVRVLRLRDAPKYLGMDRNRFNAEVRPFVSEIRIGRQGVAFDRLELDAWWEHYKSRNERRPKASYLEDDTCQKPIECRGFALEEVPGTSRNAAMQRPEGGSAKARALLRAVRQKKD